MDNHFFHSGEWQLALIPSAEKELKEIHVRFNNWATEQVKSGQYLEKPKQWPEPLLELRLKKEAILDARIKEAEAIKRHIAEMEAQKERERIAKLLPQGPLAKRDGGSPREKEELNSIDGQKLGYSDEGVPFIKEPESPYHGMSLFHYKKMSKAWKKEMGLDNDSLFAERDELFKDARKEAEDQGKVPPAKRIPIQRLKKQKMNEITEDDFPEWPKDVKPITELEFES